MVETLQQAREALQRGDKALARRLLVSLLAQQPSSAECWRLMARCVEKRDQAIYCLERALQLDPRDDSARRALAALKSRPRPAAQPAAPQRPRPSPAEPQAIDERVPGATSGAGRVGPAPAVQAPAERVRGAPAPTQQPRRRRQAAAPLPAGDAVAHPGRARNWALGLGLALVALILALAIAGPALAPRDPLEENVILQIEGRWHVPPFDMFTQGFPLGSDNFGRDLFSRLLWAVRPTLIMVAIVAAVRLLIGVIVGLLAGWLTGQPARALDTLIEAALAVPVLLIALGAIAVVGVELGIWAFILGLSLTGWVETAQQVREQTRIVKGQAYIEAAQALGASNRQILALHVIRQITPMLVMLFAFEVSSTLMATAGLGFLGYYIGGDVWVTVDDFVARRISGMPELGQMLATSWVALTQPGALVAVGTTIFTAVLGFNLVGEGLRQNLKLDVVRRRSLLGQARQRLAFWLDEHVAHPLADLARRPGTRLGLAGLLAAGALAASGLSLARSWEARQQPLEPVGAQAGQSGAQPAGQPGGGEAGTPSDSPAPSPAAAGAGSKITFDPAVAWEFTAQGGFGGGPVLSPGKEALYALSGEGTLLAISLEGEKLWQAQLPAGGVGSPAVDGAGNIYAADVAAGLSKFTPQGELLWRFQSEAGEKAHSGPSVGPEGNLYFTVGTSSRGVVQAVSPAGSSLWAAQAETPSFFERPLPSPDGGTVILKNDLFSAQTGELIHLESDLQIIRYLVAEDGQQYLLSGNNVILWQRQGETLQVVDVTTWDSPFGEVYKPLDAGILPGATAWMLYTTPGGDTHLVWVTLADQVLGHASHRFSRGRLVAVLPEGKAFVCGGPSFDDRNAECAAMAPQSSQPLWSLRLSGAGRVAGGFYLDGRLYLATELGRLLALAENPQENTLQPDSPAGQAPPPAEAGVVWAYPLPESIVIPPLVARDGSVYLFLRNRELHVLEANGERRAAIRLDAEFFPASGSGELQEGIPEPGLLEDGTLIGLSSKRAVFALDRNGKALWEATLDAPASGFLRSGSAGSVVLTDVRGGLYAFDSAGLRWKYQSQAAPHTANGLEVAANGNIYYTVTNRSKGILQAVSPAGEGLWASTARTENFYDPLRLSCDGSLLALAEDVFDARTGQLLALEPPQPAHEAVLGEDGRTYLRTGHTLLEWRLGADGFEVVRQVAWGEESVRGRLPERAAVSRDGLIWLYYREQLVWLGQDGQVLGTHPTRWEPGLFAAEDFERSRLTFCQRSSSDGSLACDQYAPGENLPIWQARFENVPDFLFGFVQDGYAYLYGKDALVELYLGEGR